VPEKCASACIAPGGIERIGEDDDGQLRVGGSADHAIRLPKTGASGGGSPEGPERSFGAEQPLDVPTADRRPGHHRSEPTIKTLKQSGH